MSPLRSLLALFLLSLGLLAQDLLPQTPPRLEIQPAGVQRLGSIGPREKRVLEYRIRNLSALPIRLNPEDIPSGLKAEGPALVQPIEAGASAELRVELDASEQQGWYRRRIKLRTDDPRQGFYVLPLEATIRPDLSVDASRKRFPLIQDGRISRLVFTFVRETGAPLALKQVEEPAAYVKAVIQEQGARAELRLEIDPAALPPGRKEGLEILKVKAQVPGQEDWTLYAAWERVPLLLCSPERLVFRGKDQLELTFRKAEGAAFEIGEARILGDDFEILERSRGGAADHRILLQRKRKADSRGELRIRLRDMDTELVFPVANLPE
jgi:hypothetical protein